MTRKKILLVEDEIITAMDLLELMKNWGYDFCEPAGSGEEALDISIREKPDLVLMDVSLPGELDGIEAANRITALLKIPVIFISGYPEKEMREQIRINTPYEYMTKPLDLDELRERIAALLSGGR